MKNEECRPFSVCQLQILPLGWSLTPIFRSLPEIRIRAACGTPQLFMIHLSLFIPLRWAQRKNFSPRNLLTTTPRFAILENEECRPFSVCQPQVLPLGWSHTPILRSLPQIRIRAACGTPQLFMIHSFMIHSSALGAEEKIFSPKSADNDTPVCYTRGGKMSTLCL